MTTYEYNVRIFDRELCGIEFKTIKQYLNKNI